MSELDQLCLLLLRAVPGSRASGVADIRSGKLRGRAVAPGYAPGAAEAARAAIRAYVSVVSSGVSDRVRAELGRPAAGATRPTWARLHRRITATTGSAARPERSASLPSCGGKAGRTESRSRLPRRVLPAPPSSSKRSSGRGLRRRAPNQSAEVSRWNPSIVFQRTPQGHAEAHNEASTLDVGRRQLLVLVDGKRTVADHGLLLSALGDVRPLLLDLLAQGLITTSSAAVALEETPNVPPAQAAPMAVPPPQPAVPQPTIPQPTGAAPRVAAPGPPVGSGACRHAAPGCGSAGGARHLNQPAGVRTERDPTPCASSTRPRACSSERIRAVFDQDAEALVPKVRACSSFAELTVMATRLRNIMAEYADPSTADAFLERASAILSNR